MYFELVTRLLYYKSTNLCIPDFSTVQLSFPGIFFSRTSCIYLSMWLIKGCIYFEQFAWYIYQKFQTFSLKFKKLKRCLLENIAVKPFSNGFGGKSANCPNPDTVALSIWPVIGVRLGSLRSGARELNGQLNTKV